MEDSDVIWPEDLQGIVNEFKSGSESERIDSAMASGVKDLYIDISEKERADLRKLITENAPNVMLIGPELKRERDGSFSGVLFRALEVEENNKKNLCVQYLYIYTKQTGAISILMMGIVPFLLGIWARLIGIIFKEDLLHFWDAFWNAPEIYLMTVPEPWIPIIAVSAVSIPVLLTGIRPHLIDYQKMPMGNRYIFRSTSLLVPLGLLEFLVLYFLDEVVMWIQFAVGFTFTVIWVFEHRRVLPTAHNMDYVPVFVWYKRGESNNWEFDKAAWDYFHYNGSVFKSGDRIRDYSWNLDVGEPLENGRVRLSIDNTWHSMAIGWQKRRWSWSIRLSILALLLSSLIMIIIANQIWFPNTLISFLIVCIAAGISWFGLNTAQYPFPMFDGWKAIEDDMREFKKSYLTQEKARTLWNLKEKQARLVIISKLQNPFNKREGYFETFRDELEYLIYELEVQLEKVTKSMENLVLLVKKLSQKGK